MHLQLISHLFLFSNFQNSDFISLLLPFSDIYFFRYLSAIGITIQVILAFSTWMCICFTFRVYGLLIFLMVFVLDVRYRLLWCGFSIGI
jgi:hypothetical protein